ncbi:leishmanolysin-related zinc metalloendopeptidase [Myxococcota bacterium]
MSPRLLLVALVSSCGVGTIGNPAPEFNIQLHLEHGLSESQSSAFANAAARWGEVIIGLSNVGTGSVRIPDECRGSSLPKEVVIDDLLIDVVVEPIDGVGGALALAGPCAVRADDGSPVVGKVSIDQDDVEVLEARGQLQLVALHEIGHVLGIGTLWPDQDLLQEPSLPDQPGADTHFIGQNALAAFDSVGGGPFLGGKVPVENNAVEGSADSHWREAIFGTELMSTALADDDTQIPLSSVTIGSLQDLGFWHVDPSAADNYRLPAAVTRSENTTPAEANARGFCILLTPHVVVPSESE